MNQNVRELIVSSYSEPISFVNFYKIARPSATIFDDFTYKIQKTTNLICWKIQDEKLAKINTKSLGIFFDSESYIIQWLFELKVDNAILEERLVYYWKGQHAVKGFSPLPPEVEEHCPVERIVQWSEPKLLFHSFPKKAFTFSGREDIFDKNVPHLLLVQGELIEEIHLYEVPCEKQNLRSRATFLLIIPTAKQFLYWHGSKTLPEHREIIVKMCQLHNTLKEWQNDWSEFSVQELEENNESIDFLEILKGEVSDYSCIKQKAGFSPKLFYLNSITGTFLATEIEYPLRAENTVAPFPFLQSHLYSATQPALFLLDNNTEIWLWQGIIDSKGDKTFQEELRLAQELVKNYVEEKEKLLGEQVSFRQVFARKEPLQFKNIFPFWKDS